MISQFAQAAKEVWQEALVQLSDRTMWVSWSMAVIKILLILLISRIVIRIVYRTIDHIMQGKRMHQMSHQRVRRSVTMGKLLKNITSHTTHFIAILLIIDTLGYNFIPLLAGAGVVGLAVGFGAQNLVKDVISGFFILFEDQFAVGDTIQIRSYKGTVEEIGLRVTKLKSWSGELHIIPNGSIVEVTNFSLHHMLCVVDVVVENRFNLERTLQLIREGAMDVHETSQLLVHEPEVLGVQAITKADMTIRVVAACMADHQDEAQRLLNRKIKEKLLEMERMES